MFTKGCKCLALKTTRLQVDGRTVGEAYRRWLVGLPELQAFGHFRAVLQFELYLARDRGPSVIKNHGFFMGEYCWKQEGAPAGNPAVCPAGTPRAGQPITKENPNKTTRLAVDPAGSPRVLPAMGAPSNKQQRVIPKNNEEQKYQQSNIIKRKQ